MGAATSLPAQPMAPQGGGTGLDMADIPGASTPVSRNSVSISGADTNNIGAENGGGGVLSGEAVVARVCAVPSWVALPLAVGTAAMWLSLLAAASYVASTADSLNMQPPPPPPAPAQPEPLEAVPVPFIPKPNTCGAALAECGCGFSLVPGSTRPGACAACAAHHRANLTEAGCTPPAVVRSFQLWAMLSIL